jgi:antitoxin component YwqK of YwqJK toxin-antitoxin module
VTPAPAPEPTWFCVRADGKKHGPFFTLFPDQTIAIEGRYRDGKLDGAWTRHYPGGAIAEHGAYAKGLPDGPWEQLARDGTKLGAYTLKAGTGKQKRWYDDGPLYSERQLYKGVPNGALVVRDRDGRILIKATYQRGKLHGAHEFGGKNNLRIEETFKHGVRIGPRKIWQFWALLIDETYDERGKLDGTFTIWRDKKVPRVRGEYAHGKRIGLWTWTDKQNKVEREGEFADGKKTGTWTEYTDGKVTFQGQFIDGKPDGEFIYTDKAGVELGRYTITGGSGWMLTFHSNKKVSSRTRLVNGDMNGKYEELTPRGKVLVEGSYASDRKHGTWKEQTELGVPISEIHYKRGRLDGVFKKYTAGKLAVEATYKDGKAEGAYIEYRDGKPALTGQFTADLRTGTWTMFDAKGTPTLVATYKDGVLDGPWKEVLATQTREGTLVAGRPSGTWTHTDPAGRARPIDHKTP